MRTVRLDYATRQLVGRMSAAIARMAARYGADNEHCLRLRAKRDAIEAGEPFVLRTSTPEAMIREAASGIARITRNTGLRRPVSRP